MGKQLLILVVGHNASGKTTLSKNIESELGINRVGGDMVRDMLMSNIKFYSDTHYSYPNEKIDSANKVVSIFRKELIKELLAQKQSVMVDGGGIIKETRSNHIKLADCCNEKVITIIVETILDEKVLLDRLKDRDSKNEQHKWVDFYKDIKKEKYEPVDISEADFVLRYDQNNSDEIIQAIKDIMDSLK